MNHVGDSNITTDQTIDVVLYILHMYARNTKLETRSCTIKF